MEEDMKTCRMRRFTTIGLSIVLSVALPACSSSTSAGSNPGQPDDKPGFFSRLFATTKPVTVPEGTDLTVVLNQAISTAQNRPGDRFEASVASPIVIDSKTVIPRDARVQGHVVDARPSGRLKGVARLDLTLDSVEVDGKSFDIATTDEGRVGKNHNKRNAILIGGGGGLGALIGGIASGGTGALIGAAAGAGAGTAGAAYTGKKDIHVPAETALTFQLSRPVTIPVKS
jgi:hypothetical protein